MSSGIGLSAYRTLKKRVFERDGYACVICQRPATDMHHVYFRSESGADDIENCISLCRECHTRYAHGNEKKKWQKLFLDYLQGANK